jgi:hypothetical protein
MHQHINTIAAYLAGVAGDLRTHGPDRGARPFDPMTGPYLALAKDWLDHSDD